MENEYDDAQDYSNEMKQRISNKSLKKLSKADRKVSKENKRELLEFKGVHYKKEKQIPNYEGGAHFRYDELCDILNKLIKADPETNCETAMLTKSNIKQKDSSSMIINQKDKDKEVELNKSNQFNSQSKFKDLNANQHSIPNSKELNNKISRLNKDIIFSNIKNSSNKELISTQNRIAGKTNNNSSSEILRVDKYPTLRLAESKSGHRNNQDDEKLIQEGGDSNGIKGLNKSNAEYVRESAIPKRGTIKVNHKTENFELVLPKIDTGLKSIAVAKKGNFYYNN